MTGRNQQYGAWQPRGTRPEQQEENWSGTHEHGYGQQYSQQGGERWEQTGRPGGPYRSSGAQGRGEWQQSGESMHAPGYGSGWQSQPQSGSFAGGSGPYGTSGYGSAQRGYGQSDFGASQGGFGGQSHGGGHYGQGGYGSAQYGQSGAAPQQWSGGQWSQQPPSPWQGSPSQASAYPGSQYGQSGYGSPGYGAGQGGQGWQQSPPYGNAQQSGWHGAGSGQSQGGGMGSAPQYGSVTGGGQWGAMSRDFGSAGYGTGGDYGSTAGFGSGTARTSQRRGPKGWQRSDERIREDICERLYNRDDLDSSDVSVDVRDGRVTLDGTVQERWHKHALEDLADSLPGVKDVENRVRVTRGQGGIFGTTDSPAGRSTGATASGSTGSAMSGSGSTGSSSYGAGSTSRSTRENDKE